MPNPTSPNVPSPSPAPSSSGLPSIKVPGLTPAEAKRYALLALAFAALSICSSGVAAMGFLPAWALQLCAGLASIFTGLSWLFSRQAPSVAETTRQNGGPDA